MDKFTRDQVFQWAVSKMGLPLPLVTPGFVYTGLKDDWRTPMTEAEWRASTDPAAMLAHVRGKLSDRKLRLYAASLARQVWDGRECVRCGGSGKQSPSLREGLALIRAFPDDKDVQRRYLPDCDSCNGTGRVGGLQDERSRRAVEVAERYADGLATEAELRAARNGAWEASKSNQMAPPMDAAAWCCWDEAGQAADGVATMCEVPPATQAILLRCVAGNPWRPVTLPKLRRCKKCGWDGEGPNRKYCDRSQTFDGKVPHLWEQWCPWLTPDIIALAERAYEERCPADRLAVLADKIEEDGGGEVACPECEGKGYTSHTSADASWIKPFGYRIDCAACSRTGRVPNPLLQHLRSAGPHCRGDWAIDLLLGKE